VTRVRVGRAATVPTAGWVGSRLKSFTWHFVVVLEGRPLAIMAVPPENDLATA